MYRYGNVTTIGVGTVRYDSRNEFHVRHGEMSQKYICYLYRSVDGSRQSRFRFTVACPRDQCRVPASD